MLLSLVTLLLGIVARSYEGYESLVPRVVGLLGRLLKKDVTPDYHYYGIPSPWLQVHTPSNCHSGHVGCKRLIPPGHMLVNE